MTPQQVVGLACRLFSIWLAVSAFQAYAIAQALKSSGPEAPTWVPYLIAGVYLLAALVSWFLPMSIAQRILPRTAGQERMTLPILQVVPVACIALGLVVIAFRGLMPVASYLSLCALWIASGQPLTTMDDWRHVDGLVGVLQLAVGCLLVFKARALSSFILAANGLVDREDRPSEVQEKTPT
ncbi:hypothetical protein D9M68_833750 [compost metagenome]